MACEDSKRFTALVLRTQVIAMQFEELENYWCTVHTALRFINSNFPAHWARPLPRDQLLIAKPDLRATVLVFLDINCAFDKLNDLFNNIRLDLAWVEKLKRGFIETRELKKILLEKNKVGGLRESVFKANLEATENDIVRAEKRIEELQMKLELLQVVLPKMLLHRLLLRAIALEQAN